MRTDGYRERVGYSEFECKYRIERSYGSLRREDICIEGYWDEYG